MMVFTDYANFRSIPQTQLNIRLQIYLQVDLFTTTSVYTIISHKALVTKFDERKTISSSEFKKCWKQHHFHFCKLLLCISQRETEIFQTTKYRSELEDDPSVNFLVCWNRRHLDLYKQYKHPWNFMRYLSVTSSCDVSFLSANKQSCYVTFEVQSLKLFYSIILGSVISKNFWNVKCDSHLNIHDVSVHFKVSAR